MAGASAASRLRRPALQGPAGGPQRDAPLLSAAPGLYLPPPHFKPPRAPRRPQHHHARHGLNGRPSVKPKVAWRPVPLATPRGQDDSPCPAAPGAPRQDMLASAPVRAWHRSPALGSAGRGGRPVGVQPDASVRPSRFFLSRRPSRGELPKRWQRTPCHGLEPLRPVDDSRKPTGAVPNRITTNACHPARGSGRGTVNNRRRDQQRLYPPGTDDSAGVATAWSAARPPTPF